MHRYSKESRQLIEDAFGVVTKNYSFTPRPLPDKPQSEWTDEEAAAVAAEQQRLSPQEGV